MIEVAHICVLPIRCYLQCIRALRPSAFRLHSLVVARAHFGTWWSLFECKGILVFWPGDRNHFTAMCRFRADALWTWPWSLVGLPGRFKQKGDVSPKKLRLSALLRVLTLFVFSHYVCSHLCGLLWCFHVLDTRAPLFSLICVLSLCTFMHVPSSVCSHHMCSLPCVCFSMSGIWVAFVTCALKSVCLL